jgi:hypothetical protein
MHKKEYFIAKFTHCLWWNDQRTLSDVTIRPTFLSLRKPGGFPGLKPSFLYCHCDGWRSLPTRSNLLLVLSLRNSPFVCSGTTDALCRSKQPAQSPCHCESLFFPGLKPSFLYCHCGIHPLFVVEWLAFFANQKQSALGFVIAESTHCLWWNDQRTLSDETIRPIPLSLRKSGIFPA